MSSAVALSPTGMRLDKWLWAARFYKTRALAVEQIDKGRVQVNGADAKPAREVKPGDTVRLRQARDERVVLIKALSPQRGPAPVAQQLYEETPESIAARAQATEARRLAPEPAHALAQGRPNVLIEVRNDLIRDEAGQAEWAEKLAPIMDGLLEEAGL
mgnify:CR=1 FL=1